jgi:hypothetical protein
MRRLIAIVLTVGFLLFSTTGCTVSLNGASIPPELKTINIEYFENTAPLVVNNLSQQFTEALKQRIRSTTRISIVQGEANARFSGNITGYSIAPVSIEATNNNVAPIAGASRLTITVRVKYTNDADKKLNFDESFSAHQDYQGDIAAKEQNLITAINKQLTEDIFNRAFANWN